MINLCLALCAFCDKDFMGEPTWIPSGDPLTKHTCTCRLVSPMYCCMDMCQINYDGENCLAGGQISK